MATAQAKKPASALDKTQKLAPVQKPRSLAQRKGLYMRNAERSMDSGDPKWLERIVNENKQQDRYEDREIQRQLLAEQQAREQETLNNAELSASRELPLPAGNLYTPEAPESQLVPTSRPASSYSARPTSALLPSPQASQTNFTARYSKSSNNLQNLPAEVRPNGAPVQAFTSSGRFNEDLMVYQPRPATASARLQNQVQYQSQSRPTTPAAQSLVRPPSAAQAPALNHTSESLPDIQSTELPSDQRPASAQRPSLGLSLYDTHGSGLVVCDVTRNTPAFRAGVRVGDTIHFVNKHFVRNFPQFEAALLSARNPIVEIWVSRVGSRRNLRLSLLL